MQLQIISKKYKTSKNIDIKLVARETGSVLKHRAIKRHAYDYVFFNRIAAKKGHWNLIDCNYYLNCNFKSNEISECSWIRTGWPRVLKRLN